MAWSTADPGEAATTTSLDVVYARFSAVTHEDLACFADSLSAPERDRRARLRTAAHVRRYVIIRGLVRHLLAERLGVAPREVRYRVGRHGKPALVQTDALSFNVSHSADLLAIAVGDGRPLGVDVERDDPRRRIVEAALSPAELKTLQAAAGGSCRRAFLAAFTRKEAYLKGVGCGLFAPLRDITIREDDDGAWTPNPTAPADIVRGGWKILPLRPPCGYVGAVAAAQAPAPLALTEATLALAACGSPIRAVQPSSRGAPGQRVPGARTHEAG